jgi:lipopolysaccharide transport system ATP-binding protein
MLLARIGAGCRRRSAIACIPALSRARTRYTFRSVVRRAAAHRKSTWKAFEGELIPMSGSAIVIENLSKCYMIGHRLSPKRNHEYSTLRDGIRREIRNFGRKAVDLVHGRPIVQGDEIEQFWALKNISFEVKQGEAVGIIGRNGAGKSTLLKILSRITEPTEGRILVRGRVASLLEVGTGFHPELTGRENIFLNGAILGMTQKEIRQKFDAIVEFAEVEKFLDTPVKRYSSGMYVRLAFAVAAHLEPEILVVDEVLAVGDAEFQKKCLGKMDEVSRKQGRTILFVSHNMEAILNLCTRGMFLENGGIRAIDDVTTVVSTYLHSRSSSPRVIDLLSKTRTLEFSGKVRLAKALPADARNRWSFPFGQRLALDLAISAEPSVSRLEIGIDVYSIRGFEVASWSNKCNNIRVPVRPGINTFRIEFQDLHLLPGQYSLGIGLGCDRGVEDWIPEAVLFEVTTSPEAARIDAQNFGGAVLASATISVLN